MLNKIEFIRNEIHIQIGWCFSFGSIYVQFLVKKYVDFLRFFMSMTHNLRDQIFLTQVCQEANFICLGFGTQVYVL